MSKIQVIALNDDNHSKVYVTKGRYLGDAANFMKECLLKPHTYEYEIREVYLCEPQGELAELDEDEFLYRFDLLYSTYNPFQSIDADWEYREKTFDLFWENGDVWCYA